MGLADLASCLYLDLFCRLLILVHDGFALFLLDCWMKSLPLRACQKVYACLNFACLAA